jgi:RNA polymerase sigma-70 factor (ECF subfamily)
LLAGNLKHEAPVFGTALATKSAGTLMADAQTGAATPSQAPLAPPLTVEQIYRDYAPRIYTLARRMLGNDADAEDVTQNVLLQMIQRLSTFRGDSAFTTWLHRVTVNAALTYRRNRAIREQHRVHDPLEDFTDEGKHRRPVKSWRLGPEKAVLDKESERIIEQAIARLPANYRDIYVLADVEDLPNAEIADMLGLSVEAVKSRLHRARLWMRQALASHFEESAA